MDVDPPPPLPQPGLKRSSSAPMISSPDCESNRTTAAVVVDHASSVEPAISPRTSPTFVLCSSFEPRTRRFSASFSPLHSPTPGSPCVPSRINQLKQEETRDVAGREAAREKEFQSTIQISQSWEDLSLSDSDSKNDCRVPPSTDQQSLSRPSSACTEPIHVTLPTGLSPFVSSPYPSPTRERVSGHRQCFSPSMQIPVRNSSFSPTPSPSPTRKTFYTSRRSLSPIAIRPSPLGPVKRKCDLEDRNDSSWVPNKKYQTYFTSGSSTSAAGNPLGASGSLLGLTHPLSHSNSAELDSSDGHSTGLPLLNNNVTVIPTPDSFSDSASSSTPGSSNPTTPSPLLSSQVKLLDSPAGSPQSSIAAPIATAARRNSMSSCSSSSSRSSVCVVPSPLAATVVEDVELASKKTTVRTDRKDFSRLFVPIPSSPTNAMDCCHHETTVDDQMVVESADEPGSQQHSTMSVDSSHLPMDP